jgi:hypothetical protein
MTVSPASETNRTGAASHHGRTLMAINLQNESSLVPAERRQRGLRETGSVKLTPRKLLERPFFQPLFRARLKTPVGSPDAGKSEVERGKRPGGVD